MQYCKAYDINCPFALSECAPVPCIGSQGQCNHFRLNTEQRTLGKAIWLENFGNFSTLHRSKSGQEPDRIQRPEEG
jgi:hypothetical protein